MKRGKKTISLILSMLVSLGYSFGGFAGNMAYAENNTDDSMVNTYQGTDVSKDITKDEAEQYLKDQIDEKSYIESDVPKPDEDVWVIVETKKPSLIEQMKEDNVTSSVSEFVQTEKGQAVTDDLINEQDSVKKEIASKGINAEYKESYTAVLNGFAAKVKYSDVETIKTLSGVKSVTLSAIYEKEDTVYSDEAQAKAYEEALTKEGCQYTGAGIKIAVLDTGVDWKHTAFQNMPYKQSLTKEDVSEILPKTYAYYMMEGEVTADDLYHNGKVPFGFDYADGDIDPIPSETAVEKYGNDHGTHVSGIAAGNDSEITGVAPDAQILAMKVFSDSSSGAATVDILGGLNDAVLLGADVINMSLGSSGGFSSEDSDTLVGQMYQAVYDAGIDLVCSAGNAYSGGYGGPNGDLQSTSNPDTGIVSSSSSYDTSMSTASIDATNALYLTVDGKSVKYANLSGHSFFDELKKDSCEYVMVPGIGEEADYDGLDVTGKIAVIKRGGCTFEEKELMAASKGAAGCIIYNNKSGYLINMSIGNVQIPTISITYDDGLVLQDAENKTIAKDTSEGQKLMSDFSSWGPLPDLKLKPEITAPGGDIYSSLPYQKYGYMSGTSMASPWMAGATAAVEQYIRTTYPDLSKKQTAIMAYRLLMSTATQAKDEDGNFYSPRKQGAGVASVNDAVNTDAYLYVYGQDKTKLELGDDKDETGVYSLSFHVKNMSRSSLSYDVSASVMTETVGANDTIAQKSYPLNDAKVELTSVIGGSADGNVVTVGGNGDATVTVKVTLTDEDKAYMRSNFENGIYVEGFVNLKAQKENGVDLTVPYLAFFGDWTKAPLLDSNMYDDEEPQMLDSYAIGELGFFSSIRLGVYVFTHADDQEVPAVDENRIAVGLRNGSGIGSLSYTALGLLRGAKTVTTELRDKATGRLIDSSTTTNARKSAYNSSYGGVLPTAVGNSYPSGLYGSSFEKSNTELEYTVNASMDYKDPMNTENTTWTYPVYVDYEAPIMQNADSLTPYVKDGRVYIDCDFTDNHYIMAAGLYSVGVKYDYMGRPSEAPGESYDEYLTPINDSVPYKTSKVTFDITDYMDQFKNGKFYILAWDYALNQATYKFQQAEVAPESIELNKTEATLKTNEVVNLTAKVLPETSTNKKVTWTSSDEKVAVVKDGDVLAVAKGTAVITAESDADSDIKAECNVTVTDEKADPIKAESVTLDKESVTVSEGGTATVKAEVEPWYATDKTLTWTSSDESVAKVEDGVITGVKAGTAEVTAKAVGGAKAAVPVTVSAPASEFEIADGVLISYNGSAENVVIPDGVKEIGENAFSYNDTMKTVVIPESVEKIDNSAFYYCEALTSVNLPKKVTVLAERVFQGCESLTSINLDNITEIGRQALQGCGFTELTIPSNVKTIGYASVSNMDNLETITVVGSPFIDEYAFNGNEALESFTAPDITVVSNGMLNSCDSLKTFTLPAKVESIGNRAFAYSGLEEFIIPKDSVFTGLNGSFGTDVFYRCSKLAKFTVEEGNKYLKSDDIGVLYTADGKGIVAVPNAISSVSNLVLPEGLEYICDKAFKGNSFKTITFPSTLKSIGSEAFYSAFKGTELNFPDSLESIGDNAFYGCSSLATLNLGNGLKTIGEKAFYNYSGTKVKTLTIPDSLTDIGNYAFYSWKNLTDVTLGSSVETIGDYAFYRTAITTITIPDSVKTIGARSFYQCDKLTDVDFGKSVESIGAYAFYNCYRLQSIDLPDSVTSLGEYAFAYNHSLTSVKLSESLEAIPKYTFYNMNKKASSYGCTDPVTTITIPDSVKSIDPTAFKECPYLEKIVVGEGNTAYVSTPEGGFYDVETGTLMFWPMGNNDEEVTIPEGVRVLTSYLFNGNSKIRVLNLPSTLEEIGTQALSSTDIEEINFTPLKGGLTIGNYAFAFDDSLKSIEFPYGTLSLGEDSLRDCASLESVVLPDTVETLGNSVFFRSEALKSIKLSERLTAIPREAFYKCTSLEKLEIPASVSYIEFSAINTPFQDCTSLTEVTVAEGSKYYKSVDGVLYDKEGTELEVYPAAKAGESYSIPEGVKRIQSNAFRGNMNLKSAVLPSTLERIGDCAFKGCYNLTDYEFRSIEAPLLEVRVYFETYHMSWYGNFYDYYFDYEINQPIEYTDLNLNMSYPDGATGYDGYIWDIFFKNKENAGLDNVFRVNNLTSSLAENLDVTLTWDSAPWAEEYRVERAEQTESTAEGTDTATGEDVQVTTGIMGSYTVLDTVKSTSYVDTTAELGKTYSYKVTPLKDSGATEGIPGTTALYINPQNKEQSDAYVVISMIDQISDPVTLEDEGIIVAARKAYDALSDEQKELVYNYQKLLDAEKALEELKAADKAAAEKVIALIDEISSPVTLDDEDAIKAAREAYDALTDRQKALVTNYQKLLDAEKALAELKAEEASKISILKLFGDTRYTTAVEVSKDGWESSDYAVIASGEAYVDALVAGPLASFYKAPVLLTASDKLTAATKAELQRLGVKTVFVVGGTAVVSDAVQSELSKMNIEAVRFDGKDRYATSLKVAKYLDKVSGGIDTAYVVGGEAEADAVSIGSKASADYQPIILSGKDSLDASTLEWLKGKNLKTAYVIGGTDVVADEVLSSLNSITKEDISGNRLWGKDRYATNTAVINKFYEGNVDAVIAAKGDPVIDALVAAPYAAAKNAPIVLVGNELTEEQKETLDGLTTHLLVQVGGQVSSDSISVMADLLHN